MEDLVWFKDIDKGDIAQAGGKGANLGELTKAGIPVPNGFIITSQVYFTSLKKSGAFDRIKGLLYGLNVDDPLSLENKAKACQEEVKKIKLDENLVARVYSYYKRLGRNVRVAVRSSATAEDLPEASFAGQQATFLNVRGKTGLIEAVLGAWASLFEARAIYYRVQNNFDHFQVGIAIPVQKMVESDVSGVMFTVDPVTGNKNSVVIEAIYGLGELIVGGRLTPDHYEVDKKSFKIKQKNIVSQDKMLVATKSGNRQIAVAKSYRRDQKLPDAKITELAKIGKEIENHYFFPQDIEWALKDDKLYIVQTRPVTTLKKTANEENPSEKKQEILISGSPASPGIATGRVIIIKKINEFNKVQKGDILVTEMTNPDFVPVMKKAAAVVTDRGGRTSHAAIVSRELGTPCVVGTEKATKVLRDGMVVTVDGARGLILKVQTKSSKIIATRTRGKPRKRERTATKLYVNLAQPSLAHQIAALDVDGVGLLRAEFILAQIGTHPKKFLEEKHGHEFTEKLATNLAVFAKAFGNRPVLYRSSDLKSSEYRDLVGGERFEPTEPNAMLGYRGAYRYIKDPDVFKLELEALKIVRQKYKNIHLMIPFVRSVKELKAIKEIVQSTDLFDDPLFKFWMMAEIPANAILLEEFIKVGINGISIGSNDLTMLVLGTDRDNQEVASEFWEMDPAVLWFLEKIVRTCAKNNIACSICGQAPSVYPDLTEKLVSWGITSISVNPDALKNTRDIIYQSEKKLLEK